MDVTLQLLGLNLVWLVLPLTVLAAAFVFARSRRGEPLDMATGLSAYVAVLLAVTAIVVAFGAGRVLTATIAETSSLGYAYSSTDTGFQAPGQLRPARERRDRDLASGLGLMVVGTLGVMAHVALRERLRRAGELDDGVEGAIEVLMGVGTGVAAVVLASTAVSRAFDRLMVEDSTVAPGGAIGFALAFLALWAVYGMRSLRRLGIEPWAGAPGNGAEE